MRDLRNAPAHLLGRKPQILEPKRELMPDCVAHELVAGMLRDIAYFERRVVAARPLGLVPKYPQHAAPGARGRYLGLRAAQQRRLSASRRTDEQRERPLRHLPIEMGEHGRALGIGKAEVRKLEGPGPLVYLHFHASHNVTSDGNANSNAYRM